MEILGIGMPELIFIFLVAIIIMGPKDMQKAGKTVGRWLRNIVTSDGWKMFQQTSRELRTLPNKLMREANQELEQVNQIGKELNKSVDVSDKKYSPPAASQPVTIATPPDTSAKAESKDNESDSKQDA
jgi:Sec-independent protein translocase protein TatA